MSNLKWKSPITRTNFLFSLFTHVLPWWFFWKLVTSYPTFWNFYSPSSKKSEVIETMCIQLKTYVTKFCSFVCSCWNILMFFECFYFCLLIFLGLSCDDFPSYLWPCTRKGIGSILPPRITNSWKLFKPTKPKNLLSLLEFKIFVEFTHIDYKRTQFRISSVWHGFILRTI